MLAHRSTLGGFISDVSTGSIGRIVEQQLEAPTDTASHPLKFDLGKFSPCAEQCIESPTLDDLGVGVEFNLGC